MLTPRYDPLHPGVFDDPYPVYAELRRAGALSRGGPAQWVVTRHAEASALLNDPRLSHQFPEEYHRVSSGTGASSSFFQRILLYRDPPEHVRLRRLIARAFTPVVVTRLGDRIARLVDDLLDPACDRGGFDAVTDLALPLTVGVICELIGVPPEDREQVRARATVLGMAFGTLINEPERAACDEAVVWLRNYVASLMDKKRSGPQDDLISQVASAEVEGLRLSRDEIVDNAVFLVFAGFETTTSLIANGCAALLRFPSELARLRADPSLVPTAVEEFLRFDPPIQGVARLVREPVEVGGRKLRTGRVLILLLASANHDERVFADPGRLDLARQPNPHLSFGGGPHHCLGAALARAEAGAAFRGLLRRFRSMEPSGPPVRQTATRLRSLAALPVRFRLA
jgi:cytochrome P450